MGSSRFHIPGQSNDNCRYDSTHTRLAGSVRVGSGTVDPVSAMMFGNRDHHFNRG
jgi:hypothetical protein